MICEIIRLVKGGKKILETGLFILYVCFIGQGSLFRVNSY